jgi:thioesterase domain-containing protein
VQPGELERYIHGHIPLSGTMRVVVLAASDDAVILQAPLEPNVNHRGTVFGGSASALAILASWALLHVRLEAEGLADRLVIQRNSMEYRRPILGTFTARSSLVQPQSWPQFTQALASRGKARISVAAVLEYDGDVAGDFAGEFVALRGSSASA